MISHNKIIVGVPVFNEERFIAQTLQSLSRQVFQDFLVLIADNASTDSTPNICRAFALQDTRFKYHRHIANLGASDNFNFLFENTESPYFMWLGAHDMIADNYLLHQFNILESDPNLAWAYSNTQWIDELGNAIQVTDGGNFVHADLSGMTRYLKTIRGPWGECTAINGLFRRSALSGVKFHKIVGPDLLMLTRAQFFGRFHRTEQAIYKRRVFAKSRDYMQHITGVKSSKNEIIGDGKWRPLCFAQIRDYWSLPINLLEKSKYFMELLINLDHSYGLFTPIREFVKMIIPKFLLKNIKKIFY